VVGYRRTRRYYVERPDAEAADAGDGADGGPGLDLVAADRVAVWGGDGPAASAAGAPCLAAETDLEAEFPLLHAAMAAAGVLDRLGADRAAPMCVFAPTDAAVVALCDALGIALEDLLSDRTLLLRVLGHHVVDGPCALGHPPTRSGPLAVAAADGGVAVTSGAGVRARVAEARPLCGLPEGSFINTVPAVLLPSGL